MEHQRKSKQNIIMINKDYKSQFSELFYENASRISYNEKNYSKGNMASNYKHPFIKMNSGKK